MSVLVLIYSLLQAVAAILIVTKRGVGFVFGAVGSTMMLCCSAVVEGMEGQMLMALVFLVINFVGIEKWRKGEW